MQYLLNINYVCVLTTYSGSINIINTLKNIVYTKTHAELLVSCTYVDENSTYDGFFTVKTYFKTHIKL